MNDQENAEQTVRDYFKYLYVANTQAILDLYSYDATLMPADLPTATGKTELLNAYTQTFSAVKFVSATTEYDEISIHGNVAVVRTTSVSNMFLIQEKQDIQSKVREFFVLSKESQDWKISRYMFNRTL